MAEPHDNNLSMDTKEVRLYRLMRMQNNIDTYAVLLGVVGAILAWAQGCYTRFTDAVTAATVEDGESQDSRILLRDKFKTALDYYQKAKEILQAKLDLYPPDDHLLASYAIKRSTPRTYQALKEAIDALIYTHDKLDGEGDERIIAQAIIDQLIIYRDDFFDAMEAAGIDDRETDDAYALQHRYFDEDTERLKLIFKIACLIWGDDDPRLKDLGFVPSSEIWTPGQPPVEWPDWPGPVEASVEQVGEGWVRITYSGLNGGKTLRIERLKQGEAEWTIEAEGLPLDDPEDPFAFDDSGLEKRKYTYRLTPFNEAMEAGTPVEIEIQIN